jgi:hypothetical protein
VTPSPPRKRETAAAVSALLVLAAIAAGPARSVAAEAPYAALWQDPDFDPRRHAAYYVRVLEIPTPRWSTLLAVDADLPLPADVPVTIQQRAWTSPIWYTPPGR